MKNTTEDRKKINFERAKRQLKQTAVERYADHQNDIGVMLDLISEELRVHAEEAAKHPKDWSHAGDLGRIRESLKDILQSLLIGRLERTETETARFIEDHIEAMREDTRD